MKTWNDYKEHVKATSPQGKADIEEMEAIARSGLQEILILTGESKKMSSVEYIGEACKIARKYFKVIGLEVYPMNSDEYAYLHECGADYVTVFQESYNSDKYETLQTNFPIPLKCAGTCLKRWNERCWIRRFAWSG